MKPATTARKIYASTKMMVVGPSRSIHAQVKDLGTFLKRGDVIVVNRSATLPSSFAAQVARTGQPLELRLAAFQGPSAQDLRRWIGVAFGDGDWRMPTEKRGRPPALIAGDSLPIGPDLSARIVAVKFERILNLEFESANLVRALYQYGHPIQYSYLNDTLDLWDQQTVFAGPPISVEPPSAGFAFDWSTVLDLRARGVEFHTLLHGAGLSSTGAVEIDAVLPLEEFFAVPESTARAVNRARERGQNVIAIGTTALRALESATTNGETRAAQGLTKLKLGPHRPVQSANGLFTGMHERESSHMQILRAFAPAEALERAYAEAEKRGYLGHEYGDTSLILRQSA